MWCQKLDKRARGFSQTIGLTVLTSMFLSSVLASDVKTPITNLEVATIQGDTKFSYRIPEHSRQEYLPKILMIIPGLNGDGEKFLQNNGWPEFADRENVILISPTFKTDLKEIRSKKGYYYPALWSGKATLDALHEIELKTGFKISKIYIFGFSAGAHFAHRFANWKPEKVAAFVTYSADWWDAPSPKLRDVPALIMCGEDDERYDPTFTFWQQGRALGLPWVWRGYPHTGHEITPSTIAMSQSFLRHYLSAEKDEALIGDSQSYEYYEGQSEEANNIPQELRVPLPSKAMALIWKQN